VGLLSCIALLPSVLLVQPSATFKRSDCCQGLAVVGCHCVCEVLLLSPEPWTWAAPAAVGLLVCRQLQRLVMMGRL
jgi:hypothetical protein